MHIIHRSTIFFAILNIALLAILAKSIHALEEQRIIKDPELSREENLLKENVRSKRLKTLGLDEDNMVDYNRDGVFSLRTNLQSKRGAILVPVWRKNPNTDKNFPEYFYELTSNKRTFVPLRGKKLSPEEPMSSMSSNDYENNYYTFGNTGKFLNGNELDKRTNRFFGLRGKRAQKLKSSGKTRRKFYASRG